MRRAGPGDMGFDEYFDRGLLNGATIVFNCGNYRFNTPGEQRLLEEAVAGGAGFVFLHGDHPCYWVEAGMQPWPELEKMAMLMWRSPPPTAITATITFPLSCRTTPITRGLADFDTCDEVFCTMQNTRRAPLLCWLAPIPTRRWSRGMAAWHRLPGAGWRW